MENVLIFAENTLTMKRNRNLLPYQCQIVGWVILGLGVLVLLVMTVFSGPYRIPEKMFEPLMTVLTKFMQAVYWLMDIGILLVALSREKHEDEMMRELRVSSVAIAAVTALVLHLLFMRTGNFWYRLIYGEPESWTNYTFVQTAKNFFSPTVWFFIYMAVYKCRLWKNRWDARKELKEA